MAATNNARATVDQSVEALRETVRERDRATTHPADLLELHDEGEAVAETFGPEIAHRHAMPGEVLRG